MLSSTFSTMVIEKCVIVQMLFYSAKRIVKIIVEQYSEESRYKVQ